MIVIALFSIAAAVLIAGMMVGGDLIKLTETLQAQNAHYGIGDAPAETDDAKEAPANG